MGKMLAAPLVYGKPGGSLLSYWTQAYPNLKKKDLWV